MRVDVASRSNVIATSLPASGPAWTGSQTSLTPL